MTTLTRQQAINAFCRMCIVDPGNGNGTWREQVEGCTDPLCPLYQYRPVTYPTRQSRATGGLDAVEVAA